MGNNMKKTVLVSGSAKGIGAAIIKEFAKEGYNCVINYNTSLEDALELKKSLLSSSIIFSISSTYNNNIAFFDE